jgi:hypothetical protein
MDSTMSLMSGKQKRWDKCIESSGAYFERKCKCNDPE